MKKLAITLVAMLLAAPVVFAGLPFYEGFEDGIPSDWTILSGADDFDWEYMNYEPAARTGSGFAGVTFSSSATAGDDYLITPQWSLSNGDHFGFWASSFSLPGDMFDVKLSTTGTAKSDFNVTLGSGFVSLVYSQFAYDLSAYAGQDCYLAIVMTHCEYYLCIDDVEAGNYDPVAIEETSWSGVKALFR